MSRLSNAVAVVPPEPNDIGYLPYVKRDGEWFEVGGAGDGNDFGPVSDQFVLEWVDDQGFEIVEGPRGLPV